jgi:hypothetical protein
MEKYGQKKLTTHTQEGAEIHLTEYIEYKIHVSAAPASFHIFTAPPAWPGITLLFTWPLTAIMVKYTDKQRFN